MKFFSILTFAIFTLVHALPGQVMYHIHPDSILGKTPEEPALIHWLDRYGWKLDSRSLKVISNSAGYDWQPEPTPANSAKGDMPAQLKLHFEYGRLKTIFITVDISGNGKPSAETFAMIHPGFPVYPAVKAIKKELGEPQFTRHDTLIWQIEKAKYTIQVKGVKKSVTSVSIRSKKDMRWLNLKAGPPFFYYEGDQWLTLINDSLTSRRWKALLAHEQYTWRKGKVAYGRVNIYTFPSKGVELYVLPQTQMPVSVRLFGQNNPNNSGGMTRYYRGNLPGNGYLELLSPDSFVVKYNGAIRGYRNDRIIYSGTAGSSRVTGVFVNKRCILFTLKPDSIELATRLQQNEEAFKRNNFYYVTNRDYVCLSGNCTDGEGTAAYKHDEGTIFYKGKWKNGKASGYGELTDQMGKKTFKYQGGWREGLFNGEGSASYANYTMTGTYLNGKPHEVEIQFENGIQFRGVYLNDSTTRGTMTYTNGSYIEGEFVHFKPEGKMRLVLPGVAEYKGNYTNGKMNGEFKVTFLNDPELKSGIIHYVNDVENGRAVFYNKNGDIYFGYMRDGKRVGIWTVRDKYGNEWNITY